MIRLGIVTCLVALAVYLTIITGSAWIYAYALTNPRCSQNPPPASNLPEPNEIMLHTQDGLDIRAWYYPPQNGAVLLALDGPGGSLGGGLPPVAFLVERGYGALQFDSRACAQPMSAVTLGGKEILDVRAGLDFLLTQPEVERIGAYGFSMGGVTAIRSAARYPEIGAIVAEGGFHNLGIDFIEPARHKPITENLMLYAIAGTFWVNTGVNPWQISPIDDLPRISPRPVLLIYGEYELASGRGRAQYNAAGEPKELWVVPGGGHGRNHLAAPGEYQQRVLDFFDQYLLDR